MAVASQCLNSFLLDAMFFFRIYFSQFFFFFKFKNRRETMEVRVEWWSRLTFQSISCPMNLNNQKYSLFRKIYDKGTHDNIIREFIIFELSLWRHKIRLWTFAAWHHTVQNSRMNVGTIPCSHELDRNSDLQLLMPGNQFEEEKKLSL